MEEHHAVSEENFDEYVYHLDEVYGNAQWALRYGTTKEALLHQIEVAFELHQDCLLEDGWLIGSKT